MTVGIGLASVFAFLILLYISFFSSPLRGYIYKKYYDCVLETNSITAEFSKYYSNIALAAMISFSNEMLMIAEKSNITEINKVFKGFHADRRWLGNPAGMANYFYPGIGFGGYCLPKDLNALIVVADKLGIHASVLFSAWDTNLDVRPEEDWKELKGRAVVDE